MFNYATCDPCSRNIITRTAHWSRNWNSYPTAKLFLGGDFNTPGIDWHHKTSLNSYVPASFRKKLLQIADDSHLEQLVTTSTRGPDLFFMSHPDLVTAQFSSKVMFTRIPDASCTHSGEKERGSYVSLAAALLAYMDTSHAHCWHASPCARPRHVLHAFQTCPAYIPGMCKCYLGAELYRTLCQTAPGIGDHDSVTLSWIFYSDQAIEET